MEFHGDFYTCSFIWIGPGSYIYDIVPLLVPASLVKFGSEFSYIIIGH